MSEHARLEVQCLAEALERVLRCRVGAAERRPDDAGDARHVHDRAAAPLAPGGQHVADHPHRAEHVRVELARPEFVVDQLERTADLEAGVVDDHVDLGRVADAFGHRRDVAHVESADLDRQALGLRSRSEVVSLGDGAHRGDHLVTLPGEGERSELAEAAVAAGDEDAGHGGPFLRFTVQSTASRSSRLRILPEALRGSCSVTIVTRLGTLKLARRSPTNCWSSSTVERLALLDHHVAGQLLAEALVGDAVHGRFVHRRVFVDRRFDLGGVDVLAAAQHHVLRSVADVDEALVVDAADVSRAQPTVDDRVGSGIGSVPVPADQHRPTEPDLAGLAGGQHIADRVGDSEVHDRHRSPGRGGMGEEVVAGVAGAVGVGLGHAVPEARAALREVVLDALHQLRWHRGAAATDGEQAGGVALVERGRFQQIPAHRGDADEVRDALALDQFQRTVGIPLVGHHQLRSADERAEHHRHEPGDVEQRDGQHQRRLRLVGIGIARPRAPR